MCPVAVDAALGLVDSRVRLSHTRTAHFDESMDTCAGGRHQAAILK